MPDSTIDGLPLLTSPDGSDQIPTLDVSAGGIVKRMPLDKALEYILNNNGAFSLAEGALKLGAAQNCNSYKLINLAAGTADEDAVNYGQIKAAIGALGTAPGIVSASDKGAFLRLAVPTINTPWGGFYLFYWCVDTAPNTQITLSGGSPVASSGATVYFDGSVANVVNVIKDEGWVGKHFHVACRYRNLVNMTDLGPTGHLQITLPAYPDLVSQTEPEKATDLAVSILENRIYVVAYKAEGFALNYQLELLFDDAEETAITGNETGLIRFGAPIPQFTIDIPFSKASKAHIHARILTINAAGVYAATETVHSPVSFDAGAINESFVNYLATRLAEKIVTQSDEALKTKL